jgi:hypothetical protein
VEDTVDKTENVSTTKDTKTQISAPLFLTHRKMHSYYPFPLTTSAVVSDDSDDSLSSSSGSSSSISAWFTSWFMPSSSRAEEETTQTPRDNEVRRRQQHQQQYQSRQHHDSADSATTDYCESQSHVINHQSPGGGATFDKIHHETKRSEKNAETPVAKSKAMLDDQQERLKTLRPRNTEISYTEEDDEDPPLKKKRKKQQKKPQHQKQLERKVLCDFAACSALVTRPCNISFHESANTRMSDVTWHSTQPIPVKTSFFEIRKSGMECDDGSDPSGGSSEPSSGGDNSSSSTSTGVPTLPAVDDDDDDNTVKTGDSSLQTYNLQLQHNLPHWQGGRA